MRAAQSSESWGQSLVCRHRAEVAQPALAGRGDWAYCLRFPLAAGPGPGLASLLREKERRRLLSSLPWQLMAKGPMPEAEEHSTQHPLVLAQVGS